MRINYDNALLDKKIARQFLEKMNSAEKLNKDDYKKYTDIAYIWRKEADVFERIRPDILAKAVKADPDNAEKIANSRLANMIGQSEPSKDKNPLSKLITNYENAFFDKTIAKQFLKNMHSIKRLDTDDYRKYTEIAYKWRKENDVLEIIQPDILAKAAKADPKNAEKIENSRLAIVARQSELPKDKKPSKLIANYENAFFDKNIAKQFLENMHSVERLNKDDYRKYTGIAHKWRKEEDVLEIIDPDILAKAAKADPNNAEKIAESRLINVARQSELYENKANIFKSEIKFKASGNFKLVANYENALIDKETAKQFLENMHSAGKLSKDDYRKYTNIAHKWRKEEDVLETIRPDILAKAAIADPANAKLIVGSRLAEIAIGQSDSHKNQAPLFKK